MVQWLGLCAANGGGSGLIPDWRTMILHVALHDRKKTKSLKKSCRRIDAFELTVVLEKTLESPLDSKVIKSVNP